MSGARTSSPPVDRSDFHCGAVCRSKIGRNHFAAQHIYDSRAIAARDRGFACHIPVARTTQGEVGRSFEERRTDAGTETTVSAWIALLGAGLLEIAWALGLKYSDGLTRFWPSVATLVAIALSFGLMALALRSLPFGTAYAVWTGIGAAGSIIVGIILYSEPADPIRILCLTLIVAGMIGLKLNSPV